MGELPADPHASGNHAVPTTVSILRGLRERDTGMVGEVIKFFLLKQILTTMYNRMMAEAKRLTIIHGVEPMLQHPRGGISYTDAFRRHIQLETDLTSEAHISHSENKLLAEEVAMPPSLARRAFDVLYAWASFATQFSQQSALSWEIERATSIDMQLQQEHDFCDRLVAQTPMTVTVNRLHAFAASLTTAISRIMEQVREEQRSLMQMRITPPQLAVDTTPALSASDRARENFATFGIIPYQGLPDHLVPAPGARFPPMASLSVAARLQLEPQLDAPLPQGDPASRAHVRFQPNRPAQRQPAADPAVMRVDALRKLESIPQHNEQRIPAIKRLCCLRFFARGAEGCQNPFCLRAHISRDDVTRLNLGVDEFDTAAAQLNEDIRRRRDDRRNGR